MNKKEKQKNYKKNKAHNSKLKSDPGSLKDDPDGETVCSAYFSTGCINEDTDSSTVSQEEHEDEKH